MIGSKADPSVYPLFYPVPSVRATTMYHSRPTHIQMAILSASGVWADTCLELLIVGQLELHHRHPVSLTTHQRLILTISYSSDRRRSA